MKRSEEPGRISIEIGKREIYAKIKDFEIFEGFENPDLFFLAMVLGFYEGETKKRKSNDQFFFVHQFSEDRKSIIKAIAVFENNKLDVLLDKKQVYEIAENYANAGIEILDDMIYNPKYDSSFIKRFESQVLNELKEIDLDEHF